MTIKKLKVFINMPVELVDFDNDVHSGWFVEGKNIYFLLPFDWHKSVYVFRASYIKSMKFLTNGQVVK